MEAKIQTIAEFRGAYLRPTSCILREIYGPAWFDLGIEGNVIFCNNYAGFLDLDIIYASGKSIGGCENTDITIFPLSLGAKFTMACKCFQPYLGIGPKFIWTWIEDDTLSMQRCIDFFTVGGVAKAGVYWCLCESTTLSFFIDYTFAWKNFKCNPCPNITNHNIDLSFLTIGLGLGGRF